ncbi:MAG: magnesium chelatase subunit D [Pseudomonadota bacterium]
MSTEPRDAIRALHCLARAPLALGGIHLRARVGPTRDAWLDMLAGQLQTGPARLHPDIGDDALFGGLDLTETLRTGRPITRSGLLDGHNLLLLPMAERTSPGLAARLGQVLDGGGHTLIALDEGASPEEILPQLLSERLGIFVHLDGIRVADFPALETFSADGALTEIDALRHLTTLCLTLGITSLRAPQLAMRLARISAQLDSRADLVEADLAFATRVSLAHRATQLPTPEAEPPAPEPEHEEQDSQTTLPDGDLLIEAALAALPPDILDRLAAGQTRQSKGSGSGAKRRGNRRGRPLPPRQGRPDGRARIDLVATLRAAAPWQRLRGGGPGQRVQVRASDIRLRRYEDRSDRLVIFAVDASGSAAFARLAEAKGAVELLLAQAYARRDHVALVSFRGAKADILLQPTRSLVRTKRELGALPGGGGTPLAAGLRESVQVAQIARGRGLDPALVLLTDGRPNIALSGEPSRADALRDAEAMSRLIRADGVSGLVIDTGTRPSGDLERLADQMGAPCMALPRADADGLSRAVAEML